MKIVTCVAPINIAVIKYWGKDNEDLIIPINDSLSGTLEVDHMCAKTTIYTSPDLKETKFWLNGQEQDLSNPRLKTCFDEMKALANPSVGDLVNWNLSICSENNFPTAAGLASSAAGYACLVYTLSKIYDVEGNVSQVARRGSGSACRSMYGGWVRWYKGKKRDGSDSIAVQVLPAQHWPEMRVLILVVNDQKKKTSSTKGMRVSVQTSELLKYRASQVVPKRAEIISDALRNKDFTTFAKLTMQDSNQFHAICLDTYPPCVYLTDISHKIMSLVHAYNEYKGAYKVAYTFDAGPNGCLYFLEEDLNELLTLINYVFPPPKVGSDDYFKGKPVSLGKVEMDPAKIANIEPVPGVLKYVIYTEVGDGPRVIDDASQHLLDDCGVPKFLAT